MDYDTREIRSYRPVSEVPMVSTDLLEEPLLLPPDASAFERGILLGARPVRVDRLRLARDVLPLFRPAAAVEAGQVDASRWPSHRTSGLSIVKIGEYLRRVQGDRFTTAFLMMMWSNALCTMAATVQNWADGDEADVAPYLRQVMIYKLRVLAGANPEPAWENLRGVLAVLGPIFAGEVTRADLSA